jgi:hypothetical protein
MKFYQSSLWTSLLSLFLYTKSETTHNKVNITPPPKHNSIGSPKGDIGPKAPGMRNKKPNPSQHKTLHMK